MSYYDDDRPRRKKSTRERRDEYSEDTTYRASARDGGRQTSLVRRDDSASSVEEVRRDFSPGHGGYYRETTVRKSGRGAVRGERSRDFDDYDDRSYRDSRRDDDAYGAGGAKKKKPKAAGYYDDDDGRSDRRNDRRSRRYSSESSASPPPRKERRKSMGEEALAALGLGGVAGALLGKKDSRSRSRDGGGRRSARSASRGGGGREKSMGKEQLIQAIKAAALAGAGEAFRARKDPGGWGGDKGKRIMTAAISAAGVDGLISNNRDPDKHGSRDVIGSAIAGLATNRIVNGPRPQSRGRGSPGRGRGRSESRGRGLGDLAAGGVVAAAAKKAYDSFRSRSRGRGRSRSSSYDSYDSRSPPPKKGRSQSVSGYAAKGLAALGLKDVADKVDPDRRRGEGDSKRYDDGYYDDRSPRNGPPTGGNNGYGGYQDPRDVRSNSRSRDNPVGGDGLAVSSRENLPIPPHYSLDYHPHHTGDPDTDSDSDLGSSTDEEKEHKKSRKQQYLGAGLATIATIHAAHSVYQAKEKRDHNRQALAEGDISPEEAKKRKTKNRLQEAAAVGIAALGIKGAYSEWRETKEHHEETKKEREKMERHREKRENRRKKYEYEARRYKESGYTASMPNLTIPVYNGNGNPYQPYREAAGGPYSAAPTTHYYDDNPYGQATGSPAQGMYTPHAPIPPPPGGQPQGNYGR